MIVSERDLAVLRSFARRIDPSDAGAHNNLGVLYYQKGLVPEAIEQFTRALELDPRMQVAQRNLEIAYHNTGFYDTRVAELQERLRQAELQYRTLVEQIPAVTYVDPPDVNEDSVYVSPQLRDLLGAELDDDRFQSVVTAAASARAQAEPAERQREIIEDDKNFVRLNLVEIGDRPQRFAAAIHVSNRLCQN